MKTKEKTCGGCGGKFTFSTANDETNFCSQLCENDKYKQALKRLKG